MKKRKRKNLIQVLLPRLSIMIVIALILLQVTVLGLRLRTEFQLRELTMSFELGYSGIGEYAKKGTLKDWKERVNCLLSMVEGGIYEYLPGAKVAGYLTDSHGNKIEEPKDELYVLFSKLENNELVDVGTYVCDREYLESIPELKDYLRSVETYKSNSVWEDWTSKDFQCCQLKVLDGYADPKTHKFYLGNCVLTKFQTKFVGRRVGFMDDLKPDNLDVMVTENIDLTPEDTTGMLKYSWVPGFAGVLGDEELINAFFWIYDGTDTYEEAVNRKNERLDRVKTLNIGFSDVNGEDYMAYVVINTNMAEAYKEVILLCAIIYLVVAVFISLLWTTITYGKLRYFYKNEDYRKGLMNAMAHDLKTPLAAMSGYAENLAENVMTEKREHYAQAILQNTEYMNDIISDILNLSKLEDGSNSGKKQKQDLMEIMSELKKEHEALIKEKNLTLILEGSFSCKIEKESMKRALDNLLTNAILYTNEGGTIHVNGKNLPLFGKLIIANSPVDPIKVKSAKLWEPFVKGDDSRSDRKGTGLGLSIAKNILEAQGFVPKIKVKKDGFRVIVK